MIVIDASILFGLFNADDAHLAKSATRLGVEIAD